LQDHVSVSKLGFIFDESKVLTATLDYRRLLTEFLQNKIFKFGLHLRGNTLSLRYKDQLVSSVQGTNCENHIDSVGRRHSFNILEQVVRGQSDEIKKDYMRGLVESMGEK
jgi:hypothetical protein